MGESEGRENDLTYLKLEKCYQVYSAETEAGLQQEESGGWEGEFQGGPADFGG